MTLKETYRNLRPMLEAATGRPLPTDPAVGEIVRILGDISGKYAERRIGPHTVAQIVGLCRVAFNINPTKVVKHVA